MSQPPFPLAESAAARPGARAAGPRAIGRALRVVGACVLLLLVACHGDLESKLQDVRNLQQAGDQTAAVKELRAILDKHPDNPEANFRLGSALLAQGRPSEALFPLKNAAESKEYGRQAELLVAATMLNTANYEAAISAAEKVLKQDPDNKPALITRARAALVLHDGETALDSADRLLKLSPGGLPERELRANAMAEIPKRQAEAASLYQELEKADWGEDKGGPSRICLALVNLYKDEKKTDQAVAQAQDCADRYSDQVAAVSQAADLLDELGKPELGTDAFRKAQQKHPDDPDMRLALAQRLVQNDQFDEAKTLVLEAAEKKNTGQAWNLVADVRRLAGDRKGALEAVDKGLAVAPDNDALHFFRADLLVEQGRLDEAEAEAKKLKADVYRKIIHGRLALERGDAKAALALFDDAERMWPDNGGLRVVAARAALKLGDERRAVSELREATRAAPKRTDAALLLAQLYFAEGKYGYAQTMAARQIQERGTTSPAAHLLAAKAALAEGKPKRAYQDLQDLARRRGGLFQADAFAAVARLDTTLLGPEQARERLEKRIEAAKLDLGDPKNDAALRELCKMDSVTGHTKEAIARLDRLIAAHPKSADLIALRGQVRLDGGDPKGAGADFAQALSIDPKQPFAVVGQGLILRQAGDTKGAIAKFDEAAKLEPGSPDFAYLSAQALLAEGKQDEARARFEALLQKHPGYAKACNDLAWILAQEGRELGRAQGLARRAVRLGGGPEMLDTLGYVELKRGNLEAAVAVLKRALSEKPDYATAQYHLGLALMQEGDQAAAQKALRAALAGGAFPEAEDAKVALARLEGKSEAAR